MIFRFSLVGAACAVCSLALAGTHVDVGVQQYNNCCPPQVQYQQQVRTETRKGIRYKAEQYKEMVEVTKTRHVPEEYEYEVQIVECVPVPVQVQTQLCCPPQQQIRTYSQPQCVGTGCCRNNNVRYWGHTHDYDSGDDREINIMADDDASVKIRRRVLDDTSDQDINITGGDKIRVKDRGRFFRRRR